MSSSAKTIKSGKDQDLATILANQDAFFRTGRTRTYEYRLEALKKLRDIVQKNEVAINQALMQDLRKHDVEAYITEVGFVYSELSDAIRHLRSWMRPRRVPSPFMVWPARSQIIPEPLGRCLILSPWNYPYHLVFSPLVGAIAAGNTVVLKPSELAPATSALMERMINDNFPSEAIYLINGDRELSQKLLESRWDHVFFTGSTAVGKIVAQACAKHLTPCTLELGGKSPCVVSRHARLDITARRIIFGKFINAGQTCVAPDYILVEEAVHDQLVAALKAEIKLRLGEDPINNPQLPKIISTHHFQRLKRLIEAKKVVHGGRTKEQELLIEPTLMCGVNSDDKVMQEEIFGPILPILKIKDLDEAKTFIGRNDKPLALYFYSELRQEQVDLVANVSFGGGCINDSLMHLANQHLPFGGVGASGYGSYHGIYSFNNFSHLKSLLIRGTSWDLVLRYFPWDAFKARIFRFLLN